MSRQAYAKYFHDVFTLFHTTTVQEVVDTVKKTEGIRDY